MKRKLELLIIFLLISLCFTIILFCKHIELKIVNKSLNYNFNNLFEYLYYDELKNDEKIKIDGLDKINYDNVKTLDDDNNIFDNSKILYKLVTTKISKKKVQYKLVQTNFDIYTLKEFFNINNDIKDGKDKKTDNEIDNATDNVTLDNQAIISYKNILELSRTDYSKLNVDNKVLNFNDKIGLRISDNNVLEEIEIYDKVSVFNTNHIFNSKMNNSNYLSDNKINELVTFDDIVKYFGKGSLFIVDEGRYDYYLLMYKLDNVVIKFISYYQDGRSNICLISRY